MVGRHSSQPTSVLWLKSSPGWLRNSLMPGMGCQSHSRPVSRFLRETTFAPRAGATASSKPAFRSEIVARLVAKQPHARDGVPEPFASREQVLEGNDFRPQGRGDSEFQAGIQI